MTFSHGELHVSKQKATSCSFVQCAPPPDSARAVSSEILLSIWVALLITQLRLKDLEFPVELNARLLRSSSKGTKMTMICVRAFSPYFTRGKKVQATLCGGGGSRGSGGSGDC